jgi:hypothetical protein
LDFGFSWLCLSEFFYKTHDPTTLNRQGNDAGTRTSSLLTLVLFYHLSSIKQPLPFFSPQNTAPPSSSTPPSKSKLPSASPPRSKQNTLTPRVRRSSPRSRPRRTGSLERTTTRSTYSRTRVVTSARRTGCIGRPLHVHVHVGNLDDNRQSMKMEPHAEKRGPQWSCRI